MVQYKIELLNPTHLSHSHSHPSPQLSLSLSTHIRLHPKPTLIAPSLTLICIGDLSCPNGRSKLNFFQTHPWYSQGSYPTLHNYGHKPLDHPIACFEPELIHLGPLSYSPSSILLWLWATLSYSSRPLSQSLLGPKLHIRYSTLSVPSNRPKSTTSNPNQPFNWLDDDSPRYCSRSVL